jgi:hypothetical protein
VVTGKNLTRQLIGQKKLAFCSCLTYFSQRFYAVYCGVSFFEEAVISIIDVITIVLSIFVLIIPFILWNLSLTDHKSKRVLFTASLFLIIVSTALTYRFLSIKEDVVSIKVAKAVEISGLENEVKKLAIEIGIRKKEEKTITIIQSQKIQFEAELKKKKETFEESKDLNHRLNILSMLVALFGYGVAVNFISKITSENEVTKIAYEVPKELYRRVDKIEKNLAWLTLLIFLVFVMQFIVLIKN